MSEVLKLSIVIPVMDEQDNIVPLVDGIYKAIDATEYNGSFEIIFVDDGSSDNTVSKICSAQKRYSDVSCVVFRRNFGKSAALMAGFRRCRGEKILTMDGDLQDEPSEILSLLRPLDEGYDLVTGWKKKRKDPFEKVIASRIFNFIVSYVLGLRLHDYNCGFKAYKAWCVDELYLSGNLYRFIPVFIDQQGGKILEVPVKHNKRFSGKSKYGLTRYFHGLSDLFTVYFLTRFFYKPMYFFSVLAIPILCFSSLVLLGLVGKHLVFLMIGDPQLELINRPLLSLVLGMLGLGLSIFFFGVLAQLLLHTSSSSSPDRQYKIREIV